MEEVHSNGKGTAADLESMGDELIPDDIREAFLAGEGEPAVAPVQDIGKQHRAPTEEGHEALHSFSIREVMARQPAATFTRGNVLIALFICGLLLLSFTIEYPDVISGDITLIAEQAPIKLVAKSNGQLLKLAAKDGQSVSKGDLIAEIENPMGQEATSFLSNYLTSVETALINETYEDLSLPDQDYVFGVAQADFNSLTKAIADLQLLRQADEISFRIQTLQGKISCLRKMNNINLRQLEYKDEELTAALDQLEANQELHKKGMVAQTVVNDLNAKRLQLQDAIENLRKSEVQNELSIIGHQEDINTLQNDQKEQTLELETRIQSGVNALKGHLKVWQQTYVVTATESGQLHFFAPLIEGQYIEQGTLLFAVVPEAKNQNLIGQAILPAEGYGKVKIGQKVKIVLDNYPSEQFGQLEGEVMHISSIPNESKYIAEIHLKNALHTNYGTELKYQPEMTGKAQVVTNDLTLARRLYNKILTSTDGGGR